LRHADLPSAEQALEGFLTAFHFPNELGNRVVGVGIGFDRLAFEIETAGKSNAVENVFRFEGNKIEDAVFLTDSGCKH